MNLQFNQFEDFFWVLENMTYVALAFTTTGEAPSKGHYINKLLALRVDQHGHEVDRMHLYLDDGTMESVQSNFRERNQDSP